MSSSDRLTFALVAQLAQVADGAILGVGLAFLAARSLVNYLRGASALTKIRDAPSPSISDLRSLLSQQQQQQQQQSDDSGESIFIVSGTVAVLDRQLLSSNSGEKCVILQKSQSCIYNGFVGFMPWTSDLPSVLARYWRDERWREERSYTRAVPFALKQGDQPSQSVIVNMSGSKHPLPLVTISHVMQPVGATPYTLVQALFGREYAVGLLDEEKILSPGKEITAVGLCRLKDGVPEMKPCNSLPYFLSEMGKDQMITDLSSRMKIWMWTGIVIGSISVGILGYAITRNWNRWKERQQRARRIREEEREVEVLVEEEEEEDELPEGQLCVLCLTRRRQSAFVPCGHMVCCRRCALMVEREAIPKCPVCRQSITSSVRIYAS